MEKAGFPLHSAAKDKKPARVREALSDGVPVDLLNRNGLTALAVAVRADALTCVDVLIEAGANVNFVCLADASKTCLMMATSRQVALALLRAGADANAISRAGQTPLLAVCEHCAKESEDALWVKALVEAGADTAAQNEDGETALIITARAGFIESVRVLLDAGADVHHRNEVGETALIAAGTQELGVLQLLLDAGARVNDACADGTTALMDAAGALELKGLRFLAAHGANFNAVANDGTTALMKPFASFQDAFDRKPDIIRFLLDSGAYAYFQDDDGKTALHWLAGSIDDHGDDNLTDQGRLLDVEIMRLLVAAGVGIDRLNGNGYTALHVAAEADDTIFAKGLVETGANVNAVALNGMTALMIAAQAGATHLCEYLLQAGATTENTTGEGQTALMLACGVEDASVALASATVLLKGGANVHATSHKHGTALCRAIEEGDVELVEMLLQAGAKCELLIIADTWTFPLNEALAAEHWDIAEALIKAGADVNPPSQHVLPPLQVAARAGLLEAVVGLLDAGAALDAVSSDRSTALIEAAEGAESDIVRLLLSRGANVHIADEFGCTPLHLAAAFCDADAVAALIDAGADVNALYSSASDGRPLSPLHNAIRKENMDALQVLLECGARVLYDDPSLTLPPLVETMKLALLPSLVHSLLDAGACVHDEGPMGTPLFYAVDAGSVDAMRIILDAGASPFHILSQPTSKDAVASLWSGRMYEYLSAWTPRTPAQTSARWKRRRYAIAHWDFHWCPPTDADT